jgi:WD40 repeat protein
VTDLAFLRVSEFVSTSDPGIITIWDMDNRQAIRTIDTGVTSISSVVVTSAGDILSSGCITYAEVYGCGKAQLSLWDSIDGKMITSKTLTDILIKGVFATTTNLVGYVDNNAKVTVMEETDLSTIRQMGGSYLEVTQLGEGNRWDEPSKAEPPHE